MYLKSITIDGFKSYGQRTTISGFDPFFNAITGLNGSGKSNILDAICFVLGISNLSQVRAANLQELVYKNGQAGITKACVSITFDNNDKDQSPVGYHQYEEITVSRQVVIGGQNKYLINGSVATNNRVKDLFQSVQLNVNNPHFLIMQGRITKVLNMKAPEILSMLEEAAGTKMYEAKRLSSQRTMDVKDAKLREIDAILTEDITPTLNKLEAERNAFLEYQRITRELDNLTKYCVAYRYVETMESGKRTQAELASASERIKANEERMESLEQENLQLHATIESLNKTRTAQSAAVLKVLVDNLQQKDTLEAKISSNIQNSESALKAEKKKIASLEMQKNEDSSSVTGKENTLKNCLGELEKLREQSQQDAEALAAAERKFQAVSSGLSGNPDGEEATLADQLMAAKSEIASAITESKQAEMTLKHSQSELLKKEKELQKTEKEYEKDRIVLDPLKTAIQKIENELRNLGYEEGKEERLTDARRILRQQVNDLKDKYDATASRFPNLTFEYQDPHPNFNRGKVKGLLCDLFTLENTQMATALEVVAGAKLYNVVVDNEETGKLIIERGKLRKRHTIIPLNKIKGYPINSAVLNRAEQLVGKGNVWSALSLVKFDTQMIPAMEYAFGNTLICRDADGAMKVAFDRGILKRTVTVEGDVYDPAGTLTGGSRKPGEAFLAAIANINLIKNEMLEKQGELQKIESDLQEMRGISGRYNELRQKLDIKQREFELVNQRLLQTVHHQRLNEVNFLRQGIEQQEITLKRCKEVQEKANRKVQELENKIKNAKVVRERELRDAEENIGKCKLQLEASDKLTKEKEQEADILKMELEELSKGLTTYDAQIQAIVEAIELLQEEQNQLQQSLEKAKESVQMAREAVAKQKELIRAQNNEIGALQQKHESNIKEIKSLGLDVAKLNLEMNNARNASKDAAERLEELTRKYDWIVEEKRYFGKANTAYDFTAKDPREEKKRLASLREKVEELTKTVNMRAMNMLDKTEEQYNDLIKKKKVVEKDKELISTVIKELDEKKKEALQRAWVKVNKDFGDIFSTLLPGTNAKLDPPEGKTVLDGLEFKVAFGNKWKESLSELSGGQRSLVALSLILALLLFNPAPIYILDEVDAALDLNHTQNIGNMLRTHFKRSQFIVVSLKDGMFNNANVLFRTKFVDGMSTVSRHENQTHSRNK